MYWSSRQARDELYRFTPQEVEALINSSGKAAHLLNLTRLEFLDLLRQRGIAYINDSDNEMAEELGAVDELEVNIT